jgi:hypothetical protein
MPFVWVEAFPAHQSFYRRLSNSSQGGSMMVFEQSRPRPIAALLCLVLLSAAPVGFAQSTSAIIRGTVVDDTGGLPGATITAKEVTGGFTFSAVSGTDGAFVLAGLRPASYDITVAMPQYKPASRRLTVLVGQDLDLDFRLSADLVYAENITVVGDQAVDIKTSTISTNVTSEQIRNLPQNDRNFLNFAALAPGVKVNASSDTTKEVTSGALPGFNTNVYIDGVSYKNDILKGGVVGQDSSRGNPFPQNAVQEFRVLTQCRDHCRHQERRQPRQRRRVLAVPGQGARRPEPDFARPQRREAGVRALPGRRQHRRADRQGQDDVLRHLRNQQAGP